MSSEKFRSLQMSSGPISHETTFKSSLCRGGSTARFFRTMASPGSADRCLCVLCIEQAPRNVSLLWGSGCDLTTASVITCCDCQISAPEIGALRPAPKQTQWRGASTHLTATQSRLRHSCTREHKEPNAWQDNCEVILTARDAMRVGSLSCQR